jgi:hypothetical protein
VKSIPHPPKGECVARGGEALSQITSPSPNRVFMIFSHPLFGEGDKGGEATPLNMKKLKITLPLLSLMAGNVYNIHGAIKLIDSP